MGSENRIGQMKNSSNPIGRFPFHFGLAAHGLLLPSGGGRIGALFKKLELIGYGPKVMFDCGKSPFDLYIECFE